MKETLRLALVLFLICMAASGSLAVVYAVTKERIAYNEAELSRKLELQALGIPLAEAEQVDISDEIPLGGSMSCVEYYDRDSGELLGYCVFVTTNKGYGGPIRVIVAISPEGDRVLGVRIGTHSETPGLGANMTEVRYGEGEPWFLAQFKDRRYPELRLKKDGGALDAITAATITSRAVVVAVCNALAALQGEDADANTEPSP